ncbi:TFIIB-type zinc ribbon-containing protein [Clostridium cadaveris]|uniref:hypothetical protein n=1 Tax=Clostridium cadaveris TaxID=1529 RepID=UPI000C072D10|nr:hypothetical protein [Clostridium cadaveris]
MLSIYTSYKCNSCGREFVLLSEELEKQKGYLVCPYCSSKRVKKETVTDNLKECMQERSYKRVKGALRQR